MDNHLALCINETKTVILVKTFFKIRKNQAIFNNTSFLSGTDIAGMFNFSTSW